MKNKNYHTIFVGGADVSIFRPAEILREAIRTGAASLIVVHNHPSGDPQPSIDDIRNTRALLRVG